MRRIAASILVLGLALSVQAQTSTGGGASSGGQVGSGSGSAVFDHMDLSFGSDQKQDGWIDDPNNPINNPNPPEPPDDGSETPPDPPEIFGGEFPVESAFIVYVLDASCSMASDWQTFVGPDGNLQSGYRMDRAKAELIISINGLSENFKFDIVVFQCGHWAWRSELVEATPANKTAAAAFINSQNEGDATGTGPACAWANVNGAYEQCVSYILITDGAPNCTDSGWGYAPWPDHVAMTTSSNMKGATWNVILISPDWTDMIQFGEQLAAQNGPGTVRIVN